MEQQHFLIVTYAAQGQINPAINLCRRIARATGARTTLSTSVSGHRRMFPSSAGREVEDGLISYIPYSDGFDDSFEPDADSRSQYYTRAKAVGSESLGALLCSLEERGRPVTCVVYTVLLSWVSDVARRRGVPAVLFWIQPAAVFAMYYHFFHGFGGLVAAHSGDPQFALSLPGLPPFQIRDVPSFLTVTDPGDPMAAIVGIFREHFDVLDREAERGSSARVLVNTFEELEPGAVVFDGRMRMIPVGPVVAFSLEDGATENGGRAELFRPDKKRYMEWLDAKAERSVVYVSYGTFVAMTKRQAVEILLGLRRSGRPYLWVVKKENRAELEDGGELKLEEGDGGMVVEWCAQVRVLSHPAIGCFVTHCGWNSTVESLACGVPMVAVPKWSDQPANAKILEAVGIGVRAEIDAEGVVEAAELARCVETVMGKGDRGAEMRRRARTWKDKVRQAAGEGGSSDRNLRAFLHELAGRPATSSFIIGGTK